jgi:TRAP-type mannitol/chloroaromatic compound transport system substrate-binding protein
MRQTIYDIMGFDMRDTGFYNAILAKCGIQTKKSEGGKVKVSLRLPDIATRECESSTRQS